MGECYENENIFPIISRVITQICQEKRAGTFKPLEKDAPPRSGGLQIPSFTLPSASDPEYALHHEIVARLLADSAGKREVVAACRRCPARTEDQLVGNMVAFWSQTITQGNNHYGKRFDRVQRKKQWAYKLKAQSQP